MMVALMFPTICEIVIRFLKYEHMYYICGLPSINSIIVMF